MANIDGPFTMGTIGVASYSGFGFAPTHLNFKVGAKNGITTSAHQTGRGSVDSTGYESYDSGFTGGSSPQYLSKFGTNHCLQHYELIGGVVTKVLEADFVSLDADGFTIDIKTANSNYQVIVEATDV